MRIDRINYQKTFNLGNYCSEKVGVEMEVEPGEANKALDEAKKFVEDWHKSNNPQLYDGSMPTISGELPIVYASNEPNSKLVQDIYSCKELVVLESYKLIVKGKPELQSAYDQQLKKLSIPQQSEFHINK